MPLTIVVYHYVRDLARSRSPRIKGRDVAEFRRQLDHIARHYTVITAEQAVAAFRHGQPLPDNAAWLTFDDGYSDHYTTVFPLLHERGWQGTFFPLVRASRDGELLDVNRVHFILASREDHAPIVEDIRGFIDTHRTDDDQIQPFASYWQALAQPNRMDPAPVIFIKRLLQHALPASARRRLLDLLFDRYVGVDPATFASELYATADQLRTMIRCGMHVGVHGADHLWLDRLDAAGQQREIDASLDFLRDLGAPTRDWVMSYPYGAYTDALFPLLRQRGCALGLTTRVSQARLGIDDPLALPRLDTNDLPH